MFSVANKLTVPTSLEDFITINMFVGFTSVKHESIFATVCKIPSFTVYVGIFKSNWNILVIFFSITLLKPTFVFYITGPEV